MLVLADFYCGFTEGVLLLFPTKKCDIVTVVEGAKALWICPPSRQTTLSGPLSISVNSGAQSLAPATGLREVFMTHDSRNESINESMHGLTVNPQIEE
jgi:hypothetical protein